MQKHKINRFIQKYNLNGNAEQVRWSFKDDTLSTSFITEDQELLGKVVVDKISFDNNELGIYDTAQLSRLLSVLGDDVNLDVKRFGDKAVSLKVKNGAVSVDYTLSDLSVIPEPPALKKIPEFQTQIKIDSAFIDTFIKGKSALPEAKTFTILEKDGEVETIINYFTTNTHRVNIPSETIKCDVVDPISFNANLFREILVANKECTSAILEVSNQGLARVNFRVDDYDSTYYLVAAQDVD